MRRPAPGDPGATAGEFATMVLARLEEIGVSRGDEFDVIPANGNGRAPADVDAPALGPSTANRESRKAALANYPRSGNQRHKILLALVRYGPQTREQIARCTHVGPDAVRPRVLELIAGGWALELLGTAQTTAGQEARLIGATARGMEQARGRGEA